METVVKTYRSESEFRRDAAALAKNGWVVQTVTHDSAPPGCARGCLIGFFALIFRPRQKWVVTYQRAVTGAWHGVDKR